MNLTQQFREGDFYDSSAVAIAVCERQSRARYLNESSVQLSAAPGRGRFTILIAGAASFDAMEDTAALALSELDAAAAKGFDMLASETANWWHEFWARGFVYMHSNSGKAPNQPIMQILELPSHPFFMGTQAHPCLTSRPLRPQPMFVGLVAAAIQRRCPDEKLPGCVKAVQKVCAQGC